MVISAFKRREMGQPSLALLAAFSNAAGIATLRGVPFEPMLQLRENTTKFI